MSAISTPKSYMLISAKNMEGKWVKMPYDTCIDKERINTYMGDVTKQFFMLRSVMVKIVFI